MQESVLAPAFAYFKCEAPSCHIPLLELLSVYFTDAVYRVPLNHHGTFLEFAYLFSKFKIEEFKSLHLNGESNIGTIKVTHAALRNAKTNPCIQLGVEIEGDQ
jgi:hypothetical protein